MLTRSAASELEKSISTNVMVFSENSIFHEWFNFETICGCEFYKVTCKVYGCDYIIENKPFKEKYLREHLETEHNIFKKSSKKPKRFINEEKIEEYISAFKETEDELNDTIDIDSNIRSCFSFDLISQIDDYQYFYETLVKTADKHDEILNESFFDGTTTPIFNRGSTVNDIYDRLNQDFNEIQQRLSRENELKKSFSEAYSISSISKLISSNSFTSISGLIASIKHSKTIEDFFNLI